MKRGYRNVAVVKGGLDQMPRAGFVAYLDGDTFQMKNGIMYKNGMPLNN
jgi:hypothetical protein